MKSEYKEKLNKLSDESLLKQLNPENDLAVFEVLYDRYADTVYSRCLRFVKDKAEAKDIAQDIFLKLYLKLDTFHAKSKFSTWLYSLVHNHCVNYVNRNKNYKLKKKTQSIEDTKERQLLSDNQFDNQLSTIRIDNLKLALNSINIEEKSLLILKYENGLTIQELKKIYNIGESAIKMRLKRARTSLMNAYNQISDER